MPRVVAEAIADGLLPPKFDCSANASLAVRRVLCPRRGGERAGTVGDGGSGEEAVAGMATIPTWDDDGGYKGESDAADTDADEAPAHWCVHVVCVRLDGIPSLRFAPDVEGRCVLQCRRRIARYGLRLHCVPLSAFLFAPLTLCGSLAFEESYVLCPGPPPVGAPSAALIGAGDAGTSAGAALDGNTGGSPMHAVPLFDALPLLTAYPAEGGEESEARQVCGAVAANAVCTRMHLAVERMRAGVRPGSSLIGRCGSLAA